MTHRRFDQASVLPGPLLCALGTALLWVAHRLAAGGEHLVDFGGDDQ